MEREKRTLTSELNQIWQKLRERDYEDNDSETYHLLGEFINTTRCIGKSGTHTDRLVNYTEALKAAYRLDNSCLKGHTDIKAASGNSTIAANSLSYKS